MTTKNAAKTPSLPALLNEIRTLKASLHDKDFLLPWDKVDGLFTDAPAESMAAAGIPDLMNVFDPLATSTTAIAAQEPTPEEPTDATSSEPNPDLTFPVSLL